MSVSAPEKSDKSAMIRRRNCRILITTDRLVIYAAVVWILFLATSIVFREKEHVQDDKSTKINKILELCEGALAPAE